MRRALGRGSRRGGAGAPCRLGVSNPRERDPPRRRWHHAACRNGRSCRRRRCRRAAAAPRWPRQAATVRSGRAPSRRRFVSVVAATAIASLDSRRGLGSQTREPVATEAASAAASWARRCASRGAGTGPTAGSQTATTTATSVRGAPEAPRTPPALSRPRASRPLEMRPLGLARRPSDAASSPPHWHEPSRLPAPRARLFLSPSSQRRHKEGRPRMQARARRAVRRPRGASRAFPPGGPAAPPRSR
mmetsp:Transcript_22376/g.62975  ORF Transcript_22376/g.62975 Transcript_22376/m.62975 type:complete len:246 (-) Transcript_22376:746-1483(-)